MEKRKLSAVVFDCDGVLIESEAIKTRAFGQTVSEFGQSAMERLTAYHREHGGISRFKKFEWFYREVVQAPLPEGMMDTLCARFTRLCIDAVMNAPMVAGARQTLDLLSGRLPEKRYLLERIISDNGLDASRVLMVGDALTDLDAARYCGALFYGRGERFSEYKVPWSLDLTGLVDYLSANFNLS